jgi:urease accessory protein
VVAVGFWALRLGGRALWAVPASFVTVMLLGGALALAGVAVPMVDPGIALSLLVLGAMIGVAVRPPLALGTALAGLGALFHGHAHGGEMPAAVSTVGFVAGFVAGTIVLHLTGMVLAAVLPRRMLVRRWDFT